MGKLDLNYGLIGGDGTGDPIRTSFIKIQNNFNEVYSSKTNFDTLASPLNSNIIPYSTDFTPLTSQSGANQIYVNDKPVTTRGTLQNLRIKTSSGSTTGSTILVSIYDIKSNGSSGFTFTKLKDYTPFVTNTTSLTHTEIINDNYVIEAGLYVGVKSSNNFYFGSPSGNKSFNPPNTARSSVIIAYDFGIDVVLKKTLSERINLIDELGNTVGTKVLRDYNIDFTLLTSSGGSNTTYINNSPILYDGELNKVRVKTVVGSTVTVYLYSITGSEPSGPFTITLLKTYNTFVTTSGEHTQEMLDNYTIPSGSYIGLRSTGNLYFTGDSGKGFQVGLTGHSNVKLSFDFSTISHSTLSFYNRIKIAEQSISTNTLAISNLQVNNFTSVPLNQTILFKSNLQNISGFTTVNWSLDASGGTIPSDIGSSNYIYLNKKYNVNPRQFEFQATLLSDTVLTIECVGINYNQGVGYFDIDIPLNQLRIYNASSTLVASNTLSFSFVNGRKYGVVLNITDWVNLFTITDLTNGNTHSLVYSITTSSFNTENRQNDSYKIYLKTGSVSGVKLFSWIISTKRNPLVFLMGDSITEGVYFSNATFNDRYGIKLRTTLKGNILISARGGATLTDISQKIITELPFVKPDYLMLTIGTNGGFTEAALTTVVNNIIALGITPIINHVPAIVDLSHITTNIKIDNVCAATGAIRGALFDVATSISNDPAQGPNLTMFVENPNAVHPNSIGNIAMYNRLLIDLPFLFI